MVLVVTLDQARNQLGTPGRAKSFLNYFFLTYMYRYEAITFLNEATGLNLMWG